MAQIQVFNVNTRILDYFWSINNMDNEGPEYNLTTLKEFSDELTKSMDSVGRKAQIRWELNDDSDSFVHDFAREQNKKNGLNR